MQEHVRELLDVVQLYQQHYPDPVSDIQAQAEDIDLAFLQDDLAKILSSMKGRSEPNSSAKLCCRCETFLAWTKLNFKAVDIHSGIDSTLMILQHRLKANMNRPEITVIKNYDPLPLVECYPGQLNQVFMNIWPMPLMR